MWSVDILVLYVEISRVVAGLNVTDATAAEKEICYLCLGNNKYGTVISK